MNRKLRTKPLKIGILGFGREGKSVFKYLKRSSQFKNSKIEILDKRISENYLKNLGRFDLIFRSPGIPYNLPELKKARQDGVYFSSVTRLFFENYKGRVIGVTGTKGKGTTSTLLYQMLRNSGKKVFLAGNIGKSAVDSLFKYKDYPLAVLEFSSFQLQDLDISPEIAVMLDVFPDHQDAHISLSEYYKAKANIGRFQKKTDKIFFFADNAKSKQLAMISPARKFLVDYRKFKSFKKESLKIKGLHNFRNAVMAATVATNLGADLTTIKNTAQKFRGLEHRLEFVRKIVVRQAHYKTEMSFYNDSASTNPTTGATALTAFGREKRILIAGGQDKGLDYAPLKRTLKKYPAEAVILFGENKGKIKKSIVGVCREIRMMENLKAAIEAACKIAKSRKGETNIIFSPSAASFDMFKDYADRGRQFKHRIMALRSRF